MRAEALKLLNLIQKSPQFIVPIYQRTYSWGISECLQLWSDIIRCGKNDTIQSHFVGSIVYVLENDYIASLHNPLLVIDGQQRLTTVMLLLSALSEYLQEDEPIHGFNKTKLRDTYLINYHEHNDAYYKLILSKTDEATFKSIIDVRNMPENYSIKVSNNFNFFKESIEKHKDIEVICKGLIKLMVVDVSLTRGSDNPQLIFESMNSTGKELSQADLIRNFVLMGLKPKFQTDLYNNYWRPMEEIFGQQAYSDYFDSFMRHFLTVQTGEIPKIKNIYEIFKKYSLPFFNSDDGIEELVKSIKKYADYFCSFALSKEKDLELLNIFKNIKELKVDVSYPLILKLYNDYEDKLLTKEEFLSALEIIESYVFRRAICEIPTNSMNRTFAKMVFSLKKENYLESFKAAFLILPSYRRFPSDKEFYQAITSKDLYNFRNKNYWLRRFENFNRKERVIVNDYTIEHIMPQSDNSIDKVPNHWRKELGDDWEHVWRTYRHTIGNLTLTGYNSEYSDRSFQCKCSIENGFRHSPLKLNEGIASEEFWNEEAIKRRAVKLANKALEIWEALSLPDDVLDSYSLKVDVNTSSYTINDHPTLIDGEMKDIFQLLKKEILNLDACIKEEYKKLYIAYKAETNFVDIIPQVKRLQLTLNIPYNDIDDPKGYCKDITNLGRWGNGDVEVTLDNIDNLPYIMGLIQQALDSQVNFDT